MPIQRGIKTYQAVPQLFRSIGMLCHSFPKPAGLYIFASGRFDPI
ncbi:MAG: hypothetical protein Q8M98_04520 [Candidatus Cloacimonadaceae bacterium]|nr:hypothetical protein [Candidatus Cloacimonadaceae bacterium]